MRAARFADLRSAGRELAALLEPLTPADALALAIVRGGMPVALEIARALSLPLDVVLLRRLFVPRGTSDLATAAWIAGTPVIPDVHPDVMPEGADVFLPEALATFAARNAQCRGSRPAVDVSGRTIVLIDNGAHSGGTVRAAVRALRTLGPSRIIAALPVANPECRELLHTCADEVVCCAWPRPLAHVGIAYANFDVPQVEDIHVMLDAATCDR